MKFYIAGRYDRLDELNVYAQQLRDIGHSVDCRWLLGTHQLHPNPQIVDDPNNQQVPMGARPFAEDDVEDVSKADAIILFSEPPNSHSKRGGRHVEFGIAVGLKKDLIIIGPRENVFHCLPQVQQYKAWDEFITQCPILQIVSVKR